MRRLPTVRVTIAAPTGQKVFILGEVANPGVYYAGGVTTALEALLQAGGFTLDAEEKRVILFRTAPRTPSDTQSLTALDMKRLIEQVDLRQNAILQRGDIVFVAQDRTARMARFFQQVFNVMQPSSASSRS